MYLFITNTASNIPIFVITSVIDVFSSRSISAILLVSLVILSIKTPLVFLSSSEVSNLSISLAISI